MGRAWSSGVVSVAVLFVLWWEIQGKGGAVWFWDIVEGALSGEGATEAGVGERC